MTERISSVERIEALSVSTHHVSDGAFVPGEGEGVRTLSRSPRREHARPTVVCIIPYYNGSKFIERAVVSVLEQTVPPDEFIVVNDGSRDSERDFLHALAQKYPFKVIDQVNGGQGSARNKGVVSSKSDYICFLDQDDFYLPNHIEWLTRALPTDDRRFGFLYADLNMADAAGNILISGIAKNYARHPKTSLIDMVSQDMFVLPSASIVSRKAFDAVGGFDPQFMGYEDDDLFMRIFRKGYTNHFLDRPVTVWCIHKESTSYSVRMSRSRFRYFKKLVEMLPDDPDRALFFFRDCLVPRFHKNFVEEAAKAAREGGEHAEEIFQILREYTNMVLANPNVKTRKKLKLRAASFLLPRMSKTGMKVLDTVYSLPVVRSIPRITAG